MAGLKFKVIKKNTRVTDYIKLSVLWLGILSVITLLYFYNPETSSIYQPCPFYYLTGLYCPGCGSARSLHQLTRGNIIKAFAFNPLMIISLPFLIYAFISYNFLIIRGTSLPFIYNIPAKIFLYIILIYWLFRNIPFSLFSTWPREELTFRKLLLYVIISIINVFKRNKREGNNEIF